MDHLLNMGNHGLRFRLFHFSPSLHNSFESNANSKSNTYFFQAYRSVAEALLSAVTKAVLSKAFSLAAEDVSRLWGVKDDLQSLAGKVEVIDALLCDAAAKHISMGVVDLWLRNLQAVAYDADNLLEEFNYEVLRQKIERRKRDKVRSLFSPSLNPLSFRVKMAHQIKKINLSLDDIYAQANKIGLRPPEIINSSPDTRASPIQMTNSFVDESEIVGRRDDVEKILNVLTSSEDQKDLSVIGIVGMPGLGKTTVAKLVSKNEKVVKCFEKIIWLCVSVDFKVERLLSEMLEVLTGTYPRLTTIEAILDRLKEKLSSKRFLLILDDVWNENRSLWDNMRTCLQGLGGSKGSRIVVTTRSTKVVSTMQAFCTHELSVLSREDSWKLFDKLAFANGGATKTPGLVTIGERIVKRCGGVPLAIKAMGGLMYDKREESEWVNIEESNTWGSLDAMDRVRSVIKFSYDNLPSLSLKQCFAYCAIFPEDSVLKREQLIQLWMAQGFLSPPSGGQLEMEDAGNNYFNVLLQRSLLQDAERNEYGSIKSCKMHDLVHDFAVEASKGHCLMVEDGRSNDTGKAVHLSIRNADEMDKVNSSRGNFGKLRTLIITGGANILADVLGHCKCLYVLIVIDWDVKELPGSIEELKQLRCLDISRTSVVKLPNSITRLYNLQTLKLHDLRELPRKFENLINLRHLYIEKVGHSWEYDKRILLPRIGQLTSLQTLPCFLASQDRGCQMEELGHLQNLGGGVKVWSLQNVENGVEAMKANLSSKGRIEYLELCWDADFRVARENCDNDEGVLERLRPHSNLKGLSIQCYGGKILPTWMAGKNSEASVLRNLAKLKLLNLDKCEEIPPLGHLQNLKVLGIYGMPSVKRIGNGFYGLMNLDDPASSSSQLSSAASSSVVFPSLKELSLVRMANLEEWCDITAVDFDLEIFPHLEKLEIHDVPKLSRIPPSSLGALSSLETFLLGDCPNLQSLPSIYSTHRLKVLYIKYYVAILPPGLGFDSFTSLQELGITLNPAIPPSMEILPNISSLANLRHLSLSLSEDDNSSSSTDLIPWPDTCPENLSELSLHGQPKCKSLPHQIERFSALTTLSIFKFHGLEVLPEWICNIRSLQHLSLWNCEKLASLPSAEAMQRLTNLRSLLISGCPCLEERSRKEGGPEWHKIAHIHRMMIGPTFLFND